MSRILVIAPHPDDEILGCGGTMIKHIKAGDDVFVCIVTKGVMPLFSPESVEKTRNEARLCHEYIGVKNTFYLDFPASMIETEYRYKVNAAIRSIIEEIKPIEVFIPHWGDMQRDHQVVAEACMVALRPKYNPRVRRIFSYETMSETAWNAPNVQNEFIPNVYIDISDTLNKKLSALKVYDSQLSYYPNSRSIEAIEALAKYRGTTMHLNAAEAFMLIREIVE